MEFDNKILELLSETLNLIASQSLYFIIILY